MLKKRDWAACISGNGAVKGGVKNAGGFLCPVFHPELFYPGKFFRAEFFI